VLLSGALNHVNDTLIVDAITRNLTAQSVFAPQISVQHVNVIPKNATGKTPLIKAYQAA